MCAHYAPAFMWFPALLAAVAFLMVGFFYTYSYFVYPERLNSEQSVLDHRLLDIEELNVHAIAQDIAKRQLTAGETGNLA